MGPNIFVSSIEQVRIHESTVACDWAGAVMPENQKKKKKKSEVISL